MEVLKSVLPGQVAMNPATAAAFILAGAGAWLADGARRSGRPERLRAARACALVVVAIGALRLGGYLTGLDPGMDRFLFPAAVDAAAPPNRMAPNTAAGFVLSGAALFLVTGEAAGQVLAAQVLAVTAGTLALFALLGYAYAVRPFYRVALFIPMAANTAAGFAVLACGVLCARPGTGLMRVATADGDAGRSLRTLLPAGVAVPALIGWLCLRGQRAQLYGTGLEASLMAAAIVLVFAAMVYRSALRLDRMETLRSETQEALRRAHENLESRVQERTEELARANAALKKEFTEKAALQAQLIHAQKMEAVGRLAGGVAHDFNNLLTAISGYGFFLLKSEKLDPLMREDLDEIMRASDRASALTRQLLAFSRQQVLRPSILDPNAVVGDIERLLRRLIGEDVGLAAVLAPEVGRVRADRGQLEQVIVNLVVNARDAMPRGGKITLETANVELSDEHAAAHLEARRGPHVMLAVRDTGQGIDAATMPRLFEPFFTTKEEGKGTGLGLSTVFGIVKQSGGSIMVDSEPGRGSAFKIYLPRVAETEEPAPAAPERPATAQGSETVLLVEDDHSVRAFVARLLFENGYRLIEASGPDEALRAAREYGRPIHLLLTDVVMPRMRGDELARILAAEQPGMKVAYMSGYTEAGVVRHDLLDSRAVFVQKPLDPAVLVEKIRGLLARADPVLGATRPTSS